MDFDTKLLKGLTMRLITCSIALLAAVVVASQFADSTPNRAAETEETRIFELRTYTTTPGKLPALHARFRDHTLKLFEKHGMKNVGYWTPTDPELKDNTLVYIVSHASKDAAQNSWKNFISDPEWKAAYAESIKDGKLVKKVESVYMTPTYFSPMKK